MNREDKRQRKARFVFHYIISSTLTPFLLSHQLSQSRSPKQFRNKSEGTHLVLVYLFTFFYFNNHHVVKGLPLVFFLPSLRQGLANF